MNYVFAKIKEKRKEGDGLKERGGRGWKCGCFRMISMKYTQSVFSTPAQEGRNPKRKPEIFGDKINDHSQRLRDMSSNLYGVLNLEGQRIYCIVWIEKKIWVSHNLDARAPE